MDWGNAFVRSKVENSSGLVESIQLELHLEGDFKKTSKKVHWLAPSDDAPLIDVVLVDYDYLITKKKIEDADEWSDFINPVSEFREQALADSNVKTLKVGDVIQFERKGFYILDKISGVGSLDFVLIPDGKASSIALKMPVDEQSKPKTVVNGFDTSKINMYAMEQVVGLSFLLN